MPQSSPSALTGLSHLLISLLCKEKTECEFSKLSVPLSSCSLSVLKQVINHQHRNGTLYFSCKGSSFHWGPSSPHLVNQKCTGYLPPLKELLVVLNKIKIYSLAKLPPHGWCNPFFMWFTLNAAFSYLKHIVDVPPIRTLESNESYSVQQGVLEHAWSKNNFFGNVLCGMNSSQCVRKVVMQKFVVTCPKKFRQRCKFHHKPVK